MEPAVVVAAADEPQPQVGSAVVAQPVGAARRPHEARVQRARRHEDRLAVAFLEQGDVATRRGVVDEQPAGDTAVDDDRVERARGVMVVGGDDVAGQELGHLGDRRPEPGARRLDGVASSRSSSSGRPAGGRRTAPARGPSSRSGRRSCRDGLAGRAPRGPRSRLRGRAPEAAALRPRDCRLTLPSVDGYQEGARRVKPAVPPLFRHAWLAKDPVKAFDTTCVTERRQSAQGHRPRGDVR